MRWRRNVDSATVPNVRNGQREDLEKGERGHLRKPKSKCYTYGYKTIKIIMSGGKGLSFKIYT